MFGREEGERERSPNNPSKQICNNNNDNDNNDNNNMLITTTIIITV